MKKKMLTILLSGSVFLLASCDSQRTSTTTETTTTAEKITADQVPPPDTATPETTGSSENSSQPDPGEISSEVAATGAFVSEPDFVSKAAASGMAEVKFGSLADRKATDLEVKRFGVQMVQDHTRANNLLMRIAQQRKWTVPNDMDAEHQQAYSKLATVMSDEFDQGYMAQMVKDHEMAVAMFQNAANNVTDAELKTFVTNTLPNLKMHLGMARDLQKKIEAAR